MLWSITERMSHCKCKFDGKKRNSNPKLNKGFPNWNKELTALMRGKKFIKHMCEKYYIDS